MNNKKQIDDNFDEFMEAKMQLQEALEWLQYDMKNLDMAICEGKEDVTEWLDRFKDAAEEIAKISNDFVFPDRVKSGCEECACHGNCYPEDIDQTDDGENGNDDSGNLIN